MRQLGAMDQAFLMIDTPHTPAHSTMVLIYDRSEAPGDTVTFDAVRSELERRLHLAPSFRQRLVRVPFTLDQSYWVEDETFELDNHLRHIALPQQGDWSQFCAQVADLHSRALDLSRPPWEVTLVEGLNNVPEVPAGSFAMVLKVHHAAVDGIAGNLLLTSIHDGEPEGAPPVPIAEWKPEPKPSPFWLLGRAAAHSVARPARALRSTTRLLPLLGRIPGRVRGPAPTVPRVPRTRFNGLVSGQRSFELLRFRLDDVKAIKSAVPGATVNDAALCLVAGSMRRYLSAKGELPSAPLRAFCPISTRSEDQADAGGNQITMMTPSLCTDVVDPIARLTAISASTRAAKASANGTLVRAAMDLAGLVPGVITGLGLRSFPMSKGPVLANTVVTNVPGPRQPLYFAGARLDTIGHSGPLNHGMGLMHIVGSYQDQFLVSLAACREQVPDPEFYVQCLTDSFDELLAAARAHGGVDE